MRTLDLCYPVDGRKEEKKKKRERVVWVYLFVLGGGVGMDKEFSSRNNYRNAFGFLLRFAVLCCALLRCVVSGNFLGPRIDK